MKCFKVTAHNLDSVIHLEILAGDTIVNLYMGGKHEGHPIIFHEDTGRR